MHAQGSVEPPLQFTITATSIGPIAKPVTESVSWGATPCLIDTARALRLSNPGKIPAPFKIFLKSSRSKFRVDIREGVLAPAEVRCASSNKPSRSTRLDSGSCNRSAMPCGSWCCKRMSRGGRDFGVGGGFGRIFEASLISQNQAVALRLG